MPKDVRIKSTEILSENFFPLKKVKFEIEKKDGTTEEQNREIYNNKNAVTVLLFNREKRTVILTRQFRLASYLNNNPTGMLLETCAGLMEDETAHEAILREIEEETGFRVSNATKVFELYSTPGTVTEKIFYFIAEYADGNKVNEGGGLKEEHEDIDVIEMRFNDAYLKVENGEIKDAKTVILLQYAKVHNLFPEEEKVFEVL